MEMKKKKKFSKGRKKSWGCLNKHAIFGEIMFNLGTKGLVEIQDTSKILWTML